MTNKCNAVFINDSPFNLRLRFEGNIYERSGADVN